MKSELAATIEQETTSAADSAPPVSAAPTSEILRAVRPARMTNRQKDMVRALACVMWADGNASELERKIIEELFDALGASTDERTEMSEWLDSECGSLDEVEIERLSEDEKEILLTHAMVLTLADDVQLPSEKAILAAMTARMALPEDVVQRITEDAVEERAVSLPSSLLQTIPPPAFEPVEEPLGAALEAALAVLDEQSKLE